MRALRRTVVPLVLALAAALAVVPEAAAAAPTDYVALGDSYAAGVGAGTGPCGRTDASYPARYAAREGVRSFTFVACSGATTAGVLADQVRAVSRETDLVTITVGGNDSGFGPVLARCATAPTDADCDQAVRAGERIARYVVPSTVAGVVWAARAQAPKARVVVLGYPHLFGAGTSCPLTQARRDRIDAGADVLNAQLAESVQRWGAEFVDVRPAFAGHGLCSADPWIVGPGSPGAFHPTATGYARGYLPALARS
ncbi:SGNH/GDSL hydrolase family protein [Pseudonocardia sp. WMMC193]|uniref:SGNH/GDSL hydrolase family protein n=1 Tax=Pseudonocardia sp. WMMC193 TaxID=2911965 RepID=UPI001F3213B0|nr:SGNH/GDSL hydrolase family protein [Pseudonocardia sp. WMMC193]MCF7548080.1 SGNH/GDSL hydrolase family protein [Pseudonocardia sp. WMMC193]